MWYNYSMSCSDWINLVAAILVGGGTFFLGFMAWRTIRQTRSIQKAEKREGLLNEIVEWAMDAAKSAVSRQTMTPSELWKTKLEYKYSKAKSKYIIEVTSSSFDNLCPFVTSVTEKLDQAIEVTTQIIGRQDPAKRLVDCERELAESVEKLITEVARIKTRDIG